MKTLNISKWRRDHEHLVAEIVCIKIAKEEPGQPMFHDWEMGKRLFELQEQVTCMYKIRAWHRNKTHKVGKRHVRQEQRMNAYMDYLYVKYALTAQEMNRETYYAQRDEEEKNLQLVSV